ncbi:MAG TPA: phosphoglycerate kinase [Candidatus Limnocylindrales bacterium]|nr:phosphoglycerate kinase [Candidatus Limnocylindrales bacterium]
MSKLTVDDLNLKGLRVLIRVDFNVPLNEAGEITDDTRIRETLPTLQKILRDKGKLILMSHLGRPKGQRDPSLSLKPVAERLSELLGIPVYMAPDCVGEEVERMVNSLKPGEVLMLENLRFHPEEEANDPTFARQLARLGDVYVNDAFGTAHRAHASTEGVTKFFKKCAAGYLMQKELKFLGKALENPEKPFVTILGGAKISGKIDVIRNLLPKVDYLLIGGGMMFTFLKAQGFEIGKSLLESDKIPLARELLNQDKKGGAQWLLPIDCVVADELSETAVTRVVPIHEIPQDMIGVDIGPQTIAKFTEIIHQGKTLLWNGPMGVFEIDKFARGTEAIARAMAEATEKGAISIVGGGDSAAAVAKAGLTHKMSHISTGGGASLEFLEGKVLPGVAALTDK